MQKAKPRSFSISGKKISSASMLSLIDRYKIRVDGDAHRAMRDVTALCYVLQKLTFELKLTVPQLLEKSFRVSDVATTSFKKWLTTSSEQYPETLDYFHWYCIAELLCADSSFDFIPFSFFPLYFGQQFSAEYHWNLPALYSIWTHYMHNAFIQSCDRDTSVSSVFFCGVQPKRNGTFMINFQGQ